MVTQIASLSGLKNYRGVTNLPPASPRPFTPAGVKGSLNTNLFFLGRREVLIRGVALRICWPALGNVAVVVKG